MNVGIVSVIRICRRLPLVIGSNACFYSSLKMGKKKPLPHTPLEDDLH